MIEMSGKDLWVINEYWRRMTMSRFIEKYRKDREKMLGVKVPTPKESEKFYDEKTKWSEKHNDPITGKQGDILIPMGVITVCLDCYRKMVDNASGDKEVIRPVYNVVPLENGKVIRTPYVFYPNMGFECPVCKRHHKIGINVTGYVSLKSKWRVLGGMGNKPLKIDGDRIV